jgi:hypothetical protein
MILMFANTNNISYMFRYDYAAYFILPQPFVIMALVYLVMIQLIIPQILHINISINDNPLILEMEKQ